MYSTLLRVFGLLQTEPLPTNYAACFPVPHTAYSFYSFYVGRICMQSHSLVSLFVLSAVIATAIIMVLYYPVALVWTTYEDLYGEWTQLYLFAVTMALATRLAFTRIPHRVFFALLAMACLYVVGEEISWGQRLLDFESPDIFKVHNLQREANIHNLLVGPYSTVLKDVIEYSLATALVLYGVIYPLALRWGWKPAVWMDTRLRLPAPPLYLAPFFAAAAPLEIGLFHFNEAEFAEILVGFALFNMTAHYWFADRNGLQVHTPPHWPGKDSRRFALIIVAVSGLVCGLAYATTSALLESPQKRARIEGRVLNGYEKFARRYERRGRWDIAVELYLLVHKKEPERTLILRKIAKNYKKLGENKLFWKYNQKALSIGLRKYRENPNKSSTNLTLARSYRQRGDTEKANQYAQRAHEIALERAQQQPYNEKRAYWLGKTAAEIDDDELALEQYRKAFELKPSSTKYRKAYYKARRRVRP